MCNGDIEAKKTKGKKGRSAGLEKIFPAWIMKNVSWPLNHGRQVKMSLNTQMSYSYLRDDGKDRKERGAEEKTEKKRKTFGMKGR